MYKCITNLGANHILSFITGTNITAGRVMFGSSKPPISTDIRTLTDLIEPIAQGTLEDWTIENNEITFNCSCANDLNGGLAASFEIRELGIFINTGESEILFAYCTPLGKPYLMNSFNGNNRDEKQYQITLHFSNEIQIPGYLTEHEADLLYIRQQEKPANLFTINFDTLSGLTITRGIWNPAAKRIEC